MSEYEKRRLDSHLLRLEQRLIDSELDTSGLYINAMIEPARYQTSLREKIAKLQERLRALVDDSD